MRILPERIWKRTAFPSITPERKVKKKRVDYKHKPKLRFDNFEGRKIPTKDEYKDLEWGLLGWNDEVI